MKDYDGPYALVNPDGSLIIIPAILIFKDGYMVLSNNMTYNLIENNSMDLEKLSIDVVPVVNGDYVYKRMDK